MRAYGLDMARWRLYNNHKQKHDFVIFQATIGLLKSGLFERQYADSVSKLVIGAYHFFKSIIPWRAQADVFLKAIKGKNIMMVALDIEGSQVYQPGFGEKARKCLAYIKAHVDAKILIYCNVSTYDYLRAAGNDWIDDYDLWIAQFPGEGEIDYEQHLMDARTGEINPSVKTWRIFQCLADQSGLGWKNGVNNNDVDINVFNGTREQFGEWLRGENETVEVIITPEPIINTANANYNLALTDGITLLNTLRK